jgi:hypothetical protein
MAKERLALAAGKAGWFTRTNGPLLAHQKALAPIYVSRLEFKEMYPCKVVTLHFSREGEKSLVYAQHFLGNETKNLIQADKLLLDALRKTEALKKLGYQCHVSIHSNSYSTGAGLTDRISRTNSIAIYKRLEEFDLEEQIQYVSVTPNFEYDPFSEQTFNQAREVSSSVYLGIICTLGLIGLSIISKPIAAKESKGPTELSR